MAVNAAMPHSKLPTIVSGSPITFLPPATSTSITPPLQSGFHTCQWNHPVDSRVPYPNETSVDGVSAALCLDALARSSADDPAFVKACGHDWTFHASNATHPAEAAWCLDRCRPCVQAAVEDGASSLEASCAFEVYEPKDQKAHCLLMYAARHHNHPDHHHGKNGSLLEKLYQEAHPPSHLGHSVSPGNEPHAGGHAVLDPNIQ